MTSPLRDIPNHQAWTWAKHILSELAIYCDRLEIAGSIRRATPTVNDLDLVAIPKPGWFTPEETYAQALRNRCKRSATILSEGDAGLSVLLKNGFQIDLWFAAPARQDLLETIPSNWGSVLLCRTGSKEFNVDLCQRALSMGLKWKHMIGLVKCKENSDQVESVIASETEEQILDALGLPFIPPACRHPGSIPSSPCP